MSRAMGLAWETVLPGSGVPSSWSANNVERQLPILPASDRGEVGSAGAGCFSTREAAWNLLAFIINTVRGGGKC